MTAPDLPISSVLPAIAAAMAEFGVAALTAPPGAGKTTMVPLALHDAGGGGNGERNGGGRIVMLEPRRLAARAAAHRMADLLGEETGETVGYRIRGESRISARTRIEVVTEGVLTRMIQSDPSLEGIGTVIFDEFHERSLHADLGLALVIEAREALRPDLRVLVMSATLDAAPVAALLGDAPVIRSEGRAFPVETRWADKPRRPGDRLHQTIVPLIRRALEEETGDALVFLPGEGEIRRVAGALAAMPGVDVRPLYGAMTLADQRAALAPSPAGRRKVVLATSIAETSLTVEGVRIVVDAGLARRSRFDPGAGMARLVTEPASRAEAEQRRGRAGRLEPGVCYRAWTRGEDGARLEFAPAEMETADLAALALELAAWGAAPRDLRFLTPPPPGAFGAARELLTGLGALDAAGRITAHGRDMARTPAHPRLAHMILAAPERARAAACRLAALMEARDPLRGAGADAARRLRGVERPRETGAAEGAFRRIGQEAVRLAARMNAPAKGGGADPGPLIARAFPDRIAARRPGGDARFILSGGKGARLPDGDDLAGQPFLAVAELDGDPKEALIRLAAPISRRDIEEIFADRIRWEETCLWSRRDRRVEPRRRLALGAIALEETRWADAPPDALAAAMTDGVRELGLSALPWTNAAKRLVARVEWARARGAAAPDVSDAALSSAPEAWLTPHLHGVTTAAGLASLDLENILRAHIGWDAMQRIDAAAPSSFTAPTGTKCPIDYAGAAPSISVRLQEMFGVATHPTACGEPLIIELLSPARRPVQTTADLPGFWRSSYADVRKDMRGRYPKHPWPEDPATAAPTTRVKPRGSSG